MNTMCWSRSCAFNWCGCGACSSAHRPRHSTARSRNRRWRSRRLRPAPIAGSYQHNRAGTTTMPSHRRNHLLHLDIDASPEWTANGSCLAFTSFSRWTIAIVLDSPPTKRVLQNKLNVVVVGSSAFAANCGDPRCQSTVSGSVAAHLVNQAWRAVLNRSCGDPVPPAPAIANNDNASGLPCRFIRFSAWSRVHLVLSQRNVSIAGSTKLLLDPQNY